MLPHEFDCLVTHCKAGSHFTGVANCGEYLGTLQHRHITEYKRAFISSGLIGSEHEF
jgi:hypothetical protein